MPHAKMYNAQFESAVGAANRAISYFDPVKHRDLVFETGRGSGVMAHNTKAYMAWTTGYPVQGLSAASEAIAIAEQAAQPQDLLAALQSVGADLHHFAGEVEKVAVYAARTHELATELDSAGASATGTFLTGWATSKRGDVKAGIAQMKAGLTAYKATGIVARVGRFSADLGEAYGLAGDPRKGLAVITAAQAERQTQFAEIVRIQGDLFRMIGNDDEARRSYNKAVDIAHSDGARMFQLRATTRLARLLRDHREDEAAYKLLSPVYEWFTEGFDMPDLINAKTLLAELR